MEFHFLQTEDGSPSLKLGPETEGMHNARGAFAETVYIYGKAIEHTVTNGLKPSFFSLGLGLGYNEILTTALCLSHRVSPNEIYGESFEAVPELTENFTNWLVEKSVDSRFQTAYDKILSLCAEQTHQDAALIKKTLRQLLSGQKWLLREALSAQTKFEKKFSCYLFDAFSSKTSPELWQEGLITQLLQTTSENKSVLSTYACTGTLKRSLLKNNFEVNIREGFAGKRQSTFAIRN